MILTRSLLAGVLLLWACGGSESPGVPGLEVEQWEAYRLQTEARFVAVRDMILVGKSLWVLDGAPPFLTRISLESGEALHFGREGSGPGEFLAPWTIQPTQDSTGVLVWDFGAYRVSELDRNGRYIRSSAMTQNGRILVRSNFRDVSYADPFRVRTIPEGFLSGFFDRRLDRTADFFGGSIRLSTSLLDPGKRVVLLGDLLEPGLDSMREWAPVPIWDACGEDLAVWMPRTEEVGWFGPDGTARRTTILNLPPHRLELEDVERYLEWMARLELGSQYRNEGIDFSRMARRNRDRFASERPLVTDLRCQGGEAVWIRLFSTKADPLGKGPEWIRVDRDGPSHHIMVPPGFTPLLFSRNGPMGPIELLGGSQAIARLSPSTNQLSDPR